MMNKLIINTKPEYEVMIGENLLEKISDFIISLGNYKKIAILTDENVAPLYLENVKNNIVNYGYTVFTFTFPCGEKSKSLQNLENIYDFYSDIELTRSDLIIALGGGVVGDVVGFSALSYLRGVDYIQIPTTLLAMIDSSVGGKTAVNISAGKNLVGAFYQPKLVICDIITLKTLSKDIIKDGIGEMVKYAVLENNGLSEKLLNLNDMNFSDIVSDCIKIKNKYVSSDTFDMGCRQKLNLGHTLGHVIEKKSNYSISHGKAVFMGLFEIATAFNSEEILTLLNALSEKFEMEKHSGFSLEELWHGAVCDKKRSGDYINIVVPHSIGDCRLEKVNVNCEIIYTQPIYNKKYDMIVYPSKLCGKIIPPPSKSHSHRLLIAGGLSGKQLKIDNIEYSKDIIATIKALKAIGVKLICNANSVEIMGFERVKEAVIDCNESGTTLRFFISICSLLGIKTTFIGKGRLAERGYGDIAECLDGINFDVKVGLPLTISGKCAAINFKVKADSSSQYISGLMLAAFAERRDINIEVLTSIESEDYINMTMQVLNDFAVCATKIDTKYHINMDKEGKFKSQYKVEADYSNGAFWSVGGAEVLYPIDNTVQGDKAMLEILKGNNNIIDVKNIPDLAPIIAVWLTQRGGAIVNAGRLKIKESNRLQAMFDNLFKLGVDCDISDDSLKINKSKFIGGVTLSGYSDHRIIMAMAIAGLFCEKEIVITDANAIDKSYPKFWEDYCKLGGKCHVINIR